jgi:hypothetical protein
MSLDRSRSVREGFPPHAFPRRDQGIAIAIAASFRQRLVEEMHRVIAGDHRERWAAAVLFVECGQKGFIERRIVNCRIMVCCNQTKHALVR